MGNKKILFFVRSAKYLKAMRSFIAELIRRSFSVHIVYEPSEEDASSHDVLERFARELPGFSYESGKRRSGPLKKIARALRGLSSYRKFLVLDGFDSFYAQHWFKFLPRSAQSALRSFPLLRSTLALSLAERFLDVCEMSLPVDEKIKQHIRRINPAAVIVAYRGQPPGSADADYLKAAKKLGIPTIIPVASWDALTTKGKIHSQPVLLLVWNEKQKKDAMKHHGISPAAIKIVGAFQFDDWSEKQLPIVHRGESEHKAIFYIASGALSGDSGRVPDALRRAMDADPFLKQCPLIVRPPLYNARAFQTSEKNIILIPPSYERMSGNESVELFLRAISLSFVAVGIHTTGLIDAMFKGLPVIIYAPPEFRAAQDVPHFRELLENDAAERAESPQEFVRIAAALTVGNDRKREQRERFIQTLRPPASYRTAAAAAVDYIEKAIQKR